MGWYRLVDAHTIDLYAYAPRFRETARQHARAALSLPEGKRTAIPVKLSAYGLLRPLQAAWKSFYDFQQPQYVKILTY